MARGGGRRRPQINVALAEDQALALQLLSARERCSVPALLEPVITAYLGHELARDPALRRAFEAMKASRNRASKTATVVTSLSPPDAG